LRYHIAGVLRQKCLYIYNRFFIRTLIFQTEEDVTMAWLFLIIAGIIEIGWAITLKYTEGFTRFWPSAGMLAAAIASFFFLSNSLKTIPVGTAYVVFTGIGTIGTVLFGIFFLGESKDIWRLGFIGLIIIGTVGLKFAGE
jgi:quaternary ammonium compound-resistance protein SugE